MYNVPIALLYKQVYNVITVKETDSRKAERKITMKKSAETMTRQAERRVKAMSDNLLLAAWESTEDQRTKESVIIRGWLMDEIERRYPEAFNAWLDNDAYDGELRAYVNNNAE